MLCKSQVVTCGKTLHAVCACRLEGEVIVVHFNFLAVTLIIEAVFDVSQF